jgi:uridine kinase
MTIIGIAGGSGSGKTTFALRLQEFLGRDRCAILHQDSYYHDLSHAFDRDGGNVNFDHPDAIDFELLRNHLKKLAAGHTVEVPVYDYATHRRLSQTHSLAATPLLVVEGMLVLSQHSIRERMNLKVFIEATEQVRLARRLARDVRERGRDPAGIEQQFLTQVKPMHDRFVEPSRQHADAVYSGEEALETQIRDLLIHLEITR